MRYQVYHYGWLADNEDVEIFTLFKLDSNNVSRRVGLFSSLEKAKERIKRMQSPKCKLHNFTSTLVHEE